MTDLFVSSPELIYTISRIQDTILTESGTEIIDKQDELFSDADTERHK